MTWFRIEEGLGFRVGRRMRLELITDAELGLRVWGLHLLDERARPPHVLQGVARDHDFVLLLGAVHHAPLPHDRDTHHLPLGANFSTPHAFRVRKVEG